MYDSMRNREERNLFRIVNVYQESTKAINIMSKSNTYHKQFSNFTLNDLYKKSPLTEWQLLKYCPTSSTKYYQIWKNPSKEQKDEIIAGDHCCKMCGDVRNPSG
jgi:hypothetical protein